MPLSVTLTVRYCAAGTASASAAGEFRSEGDAHLHVPLLRGVFQGVGDQVRQNLAELVDVHGDDEPFRREIQIDRDLFLAGIAGEAVHQPPDVGQNVLPADREGQRVVFDAAQRERLIDQIEQFLDIVVDQADQLPHPSSCRSLPAAC